MTISVLSLFRAIGSKLPQCSFIVFFSLNCTACSGGSDQTPNPPAPPGGKSITLSWTAPTQNEDGTTLNDIDHYRFYYGKSAGDYTSVATVPLTNCVATTCTYSLTGLDNVTYYLTVTAVDSNGEESDFATPVMK